MHATKLTNKKWQEFIVDDVLVESDVYPSGFLVDLGHWEGARSLADCGRYHVVEADPHRLVDRQWNVLVCAEIAWERESHT